MQQARSPPCGGVERVFGEAAAGEQGGAWLRRMRFMAGVRGLVTLVPLSHGVPAPELAVEERPADKSKALCDTLVPAKLAVIEAAASCCTSLQASGERGRVLGAR